MPAPIDRIAILTLAVLLSTSAFGQTPTWPTPGDIDRALQRHPFPTPDRIQRQPIPLPAQINPTRPGLDIDALVRARAGLATPGVSATAPPASLRIFVTLDMPRGSLDRLTDQAAHTGAMLVLRGLKAHSMRQTLEAIHTLIGERRVTWTIDPEAFARFGVQHAPTFVLALAPTPDPPPGCGIQCPIPAPYAKVTGDVSTGYALETIVRRHPEAAAQATALLQRLRAMP